MFNRLNKQSIHTIISLIIAIMVLLSSCSIGIFSFIVYRNNCYELTKQKALGIAETVAAFIDGDSFSVIDRTGIKDDYYYRIQRLIIRAQIRSDVTYLYAITDNHDGQNYKYIFDAEGEQEFNTLDPYDIFRAEVPFTEGKSVVEIFNSDEYGTMVASYVPIFDSYHNIVGVVGVDIDLNSVIDALNTFINNMIVAILFFNMIFIFILRFYLGRFIVEPIKRIANNAVKLADGHLDIEFDTTIEDPDTKNELKDLQSVLRKAIHELNQNHELKLIAAKAKFEAEKAEANSASKERYFANLSHEIRTPMNAIMGMSELLLAGHLTDEQHKYINSIKDSSHMLINLLNDILDLSKMEMGDLSLIPVHYDFRMLIDNLCSIALFLAEEKDLRFDCKIIGQMPKCLYGDDYRLRQILYNIINNSIKFTHSGKVNLKITINENDLHFDVTDTGIGIKEEDMSIMFEAFGQVDMVKNKNLKGTGLGLTICKQLVDMMEGSISVESIYGEGSVFHVVIPLVLGDEMVLTNYTYQAISFYAPTAKILAVDDNEINLNVAQGLLSLFEIHCDKALSGPEAIDMVQKTEYDLIFMDHMMPEMDGVETTSRIRALGGEYSSIPIIALTANAVSGTREALLSMGLDDFLAKPIEKAKLQAILAKWIPADKKEERDTDPLEEKTTTNDQYSEILKHASKIDELDVALGLDRVAMQQDTYEKSLQLADVKIPVFIENIKKLLENKELKTYSIQVHGMKGVLANIGAMQLSNLALSLELASRDNDILKCQEEMPAFITELNAFSKKLHKLFSDVNKADKPPGDQAMLESCINELYIALEDYDYDAAAAIISKLLQFDFGEDANNNINKIKSFIDEYDYDSATLYMQTELGITHS